MRDTPDVAGAPDVVLESLLSVVGIGALELYAAPQGVAGGVCGVTVLDILDPIYPAGHVVLVVGIEPHTLEALDIVRAAGAANAAAVVFRQPRTREDPRDLRDAAAASGLAVLFRTPWLGWAGLVGALRAGLAGASIPVDPEISRVAPGNLDALADAIAVKVRGAVTIEDIHSRVLAYSSSEVEVDSLRRLTILGRRVPQWRINALQETGFFRALWASGDVVHRPADRDVPERLAIAVKAGDEILGSIWVAAYEADHALAATAAEALKALALAAAPHLLYHRSFHGGRAYLIEEAARDLLDGRGSAELLSERASLPLSTPAVVLAIHAGPGDDAEFVGPRFSGLVALYSGVHGCKTIVVSRPEGASALLTSVEQSTVGLEQRIMTMAESLAANLSDVLGTRVWIGVGELAATLREAQTSASAADLALRAVRFANSPRSVACMAMLGDAAALVQFADAVEGVDLRNQTGLDLLESYDAEREGSGMVATLRAYLDSFGSISEAARSLGFHPNSLRYRLTRIQELSGIDLSDPDARLLAQIQLRLTRRPSLPIRE